MRRYRVGLCGSLFLGTATFIFSFTLNVALSDGSWKIQMPSAYAKDGNNGGGKGNGGGNGNGNGSGSGSGNNGANGNAGSNGSGASSNGSSNSGNNGSTSNGSSTTSAAPADPRSADDTNDPAATSPLNVRHTNGFTESIAKGSYVMKDSKGRVVVDRRARPDDVRRLKSAGD
jgi:hypothetical protein